MKRDIEKDTRLSPAGMTDARRDLGKVLRAAFEKAVAPALRELEERERRCREQLRGAAEGDDDGDIGTCVSLAMARAATRAKLDALPALQVEAFYRSATPNDRLALREARRLVVREGGVAQEDWVRAEVVDEVEVAEGRRALPDVAAELEDARAVSGMIRTLRGRFEVEAGALCGGDAPAPVDLMH